MDIIDVLRTRMQAAMNNATWEVNCILADPLRRGAVDDLSKWVDIYSCSHAKMDMLDRLKAQKDSDAYEEQNNTTNS